MKPKIGMAHWEGGLRDGRGTISTETGVLRAAPYGFRARFEEGPGSNPEELIGAAHAACFSMALSMILGEAGMKATSIDTSAAVTLEKNDDGFAITKIHLDVRASIPGADSDAFQTAAQAAKAGCPVSKVLDAEITMDAKLA